MYLALCACGFPWWKLEGGGGCWGENVTVTVGTKKQWVLIKRVTYKIKKHMGLQSNIPFYWTSFIPPLLSSISSPSHSLHPCWHSFSYPQYEASEENNTVCTRDYPFPSVTAMYTQRETLWRLGKKLWTWGNFHLCMAIILGLAPSFSEKTLRVEKEINALPSPHSAFLHS